MKYTRELENVVYKFQTVAHPAIFQSPKAPYHWWFLLKYLYSEEGLPKIPWTCKRLSQENGKYTEVISEFEKQCVLKS